MLNHVLHTLGTTISFSADEDYFSTKMDMVSTERGKLKYEHGCFMYSFDKCDYVS